MGEKLRVLVVDHVAGVELFRKKYDHLAADPDLDLTVLIPKSWIENGREVCAPESASGYRVLTAKAAWRGYENRAFFYSGLIAAIRKARPDVLHLVEEPFSLMALQCALLCRLLRPRARILFYTFDNLHRGFRYSYRPGWIYGWIQRAVQAASHCGTASCREAGDILRSRGYRKPLRYIPLAVDPERYRPIAGAEAGRALVIGFVGRLLPMKGVDVLIEALARLSTDWRLLVVGGGPEGERVRATARERGWEDRLEITGAVAHDDVPRLMNRMDVLVLPSLSTPHWKEQFGRVLIEAMASEVTVIGSDSGAIPEVIGGAGIVVPEGDAAALAAALLRLQEDEPERRRLAQTGRERVLQHFTWERVAQMYREVYHGLMTDSLPSEDAPRWVQAPR